MQTYNKKHIAKMTDANLTKLLKSMGKDEKFIGNFIAELHPKKKEPAKKANDVKEIPEVVKPE